jgi:predicted transcriptional regulator
MQTIDRAFAVLRALASRSETSTLADTSRAVGLPKSTTSRILTALEDLGMVDRVGGRYSIGSGLATLTHVATPVASLRDVSRPYLADLAERLGENASLAVADGEEVLRRLGLQLGCDHRAELDRRTGAIPRLGSGAGADDGLECRSPRSVCRDRACVADAGDGHVGDRSSTTHEAGTHRRVRMDAGRVLRRGQRCGGADPRAEISGDRGNQRVWTRVPFSGSRPTRLDRSNRRRRRRAARTTPRRGLARHRSVAVGDEHAHHRAAGVGPTRRGERLNVLAAPAGFVEGSLGSLEGGAAQQQSSVADNVVDRVVQREPVVPHDHLPLTPPHPAGELGARHVPV